jgi:hypothetical protein
LLLRLKIIKALFPDAMKLSLATLILLTSLPTLQADVAPAPPPVTQAITSFGACISDGYVYVYGGHTGEAHDHSRDNLSPEFIRYPLNQAGAAWEKLPADKAVQGTALVSWNGKVIRVILSRSFSESEAYFYQRRMSQSLAS